MNISRRRYLALLGGAASVATAGCGTGGGVNRTTYDAPTVSVPDEAKSFLQNASNFDGTALDLTDRGEVTVSVGTKANGAYYGFSPVAITITTGTTVTWDWTGKGAAHNVVENDGVFRSGIPKADAGTTFERTFGESGHYLYYCTPHLRNGMKGVVIVE